MIRWTIVCLLFGCNQVFGLQPTQSAPGIDAQFFDAPPFGCPATGAPTYTRVLHQDVLQPVIEYTVSETAGRAMAYDFTRAITVEGPVDGVMKPAPDFPGGGQLTVTTDQPRLAPEGDVATARTTKFGTSTLALYRRVGGKWPKIADLGIPLGPPDFMSSMTRGPMRRALISASGVFHEYEFDDSGTASEIVPAYSPGELGLFSMSSPMLGADGLRLVLQASSFAGAPPRMYYAERPGLSARFTAAQEIAMPVVTDPYLTEDCSRIYFSGLDSIWYVQEPQ